MATQIRISSVGDVAFEGKDWAQPSAEVFSNAKHLLKDSDLTIGNLENPLTGSHKKVQGKCTLHGSPGWAKVMREMGFGLVTLANNHTMDFGVRGLESTMTALEGAGIRYVGAGMNVEKARAPAFLEIKGQPCECGCRLPLLSRFDGRVTDILYRPDGSTVAGLILVDMFLDEPAIKEMQIIQESLNNIDLFVVAGKTFNETHKIQAVKALQQFMGGEVKVNLKVVPEIERNPVSGKFQEVICKVR
jgi:hypothetical protein